MKPPQTVFDILEKQGNFWEGFINYSALKSNYLRERNSIFIPKEHQRDQIKEYILKHRIGEDSFKELTKLPEVKSKKEEIKDISEKIPDKPISKKRIKKAKARDFIFELENCTLNTDPKKYTAWTKEKKVKKIEPTKSDTYSDTISTILSKH
jgi:hypothetical protein